MTGWGGALLKKHCRYKQYCCHKQYCHLRKVCVKNTQVSG
jgi:hypothetical protein